MHFLTDKIEFPPVDTANEYGMVAVGGDLSIERLLLAYKSGIFPWYSEGEPIVWYSPNPRMVLFPDELKISKSMRQILKKGDFKVTFNKAFKEVIQNCKTINRVEQGETGTWITDKMKEAYIELHKLGIAKSVEVWQLDTERLALSGSDVYRNEANKISDLIKLHENYNLVGGLYGLEIGNIFCGESMFSNVSNASKSAFIHLVQINSYKLIDCQIYNPHLASLGAKEISRAEFLEYL